MTRRAARRYSALMPGVAREPGKLAVAAEEEVGRIVRCRLRKFGDVFSCQRRRIGETNMAGAACLRRRIEVWCLDVVTCKAFRDDSIAHNHSRRPGLVVAVAAIPDERAVRDVLHGCSAVMRMVRETAVAAPRANPGLPRYDFLDHSIMTGLAADRFGPD